MNRNEQEQIRHEEFLKSLNEASNISELPKKINASTILSTLTSLASFKDSRMEKDKMQVFVYKLTGDLSYIISKEFSDSLQEVLRDNNLSKDAEVIHNKAMEIITNKRLFNLVSEYHRWNNKYLDLLYKQITKKHEDVMKQINRAYEIEDLPKVSIASINRQISIILYDLFNKKQLKVDSTGKISKLLVNGISFDNVQMKKSVEYICKKNKMIESFESMSLSEKVDYVISILESNYVLDYLVQEVIAKEKRVLFIYKEEHEDIMNQINSATRIRELPNNISLSKITSYLSGNSLIVPKGPVVSSTDFIKIANLLIEGKKFSDDEIKSELGKIVFKYYEDEQVQFPFDLLYKKLSSLPKLDYYVEEVREYIKRQNEFVKRGSSNVNVYMIPNDHSPLDGGKFYNIYISSAVDLNLEEILPLNLNEIVPPNMDVDAIEWYVRNHEKGDKTFKAAGGIILNKDESIGSVNVFKPADGKVGITPEEKKNYQQLEDLSKKLKEITDKSKKAKEEYLKSQASIDEEITSIQTEITSLIEDNEKKKKVLKNTSN
ncbi:MAG: FlxA-like family protein [Bacilli bacterium]|nr:FlxA-like family protein [Bacilli bacterium]